MSSIRDKLKERSIKIKRKIQETLRDSEEDLYISSDDLLNNIKIVFIGDHSFTNQQIMDNFAPEGKQEETLVLLKKVFQNKYPITRHHGIPRVPELDKDKNLLIDSLNHYFNKLRSEIIELKRKKHDSVTLREKIEHLQKINILIDHFTNDKEIFPYHNFKDYLSNKEYINSVGDFDEGMRLVRGKQSEEERVRNLLRQFVKVYLQNKTKKDFDVHDPGVFKEQFQTFKSDYEGKIPQILIYLMEILEGEKLLAPSKSEYDFTTIYKTLEQLRDKFAQAEDKVDPQFPSDKLTGGAIPVVDKNKSAIEETIQEVVDYMIEEYIKLKSAYDITLKESLSKDNKIASLETDLKTQKEKIENATLKIKEYIKEIAENKKIIQELLKKCKDKESRDERLAYKKLVDIFGKDYDEFEEETPKEKTSTSLNTIVSNIDNLPLSDQIELFDQIRNTENIDESVNVLKNELGKKQLFIDRDWSPDERMDLKTLLERIKATKDNREAAKVLTNSARIFNNNSNNDSVRPQRYNNNDNNNAQTYATSTFGENINDRGYGENYYEPEFPQRQGERNNNSKSYATSTFGENINDRGYGENYYEPEFPQREEKQSKQNTNNAFSGVRSMFNSNFEEEPKREEKPLTLDKALELLGLNKEDLDILLLERRINNILSAINRKYESKRSLNEDLYLQAKNLLENYYERQYQEESESKNEINKEEFDKALKVLRLENKKPLIKRDIVKRYRELSREKHPNRGGNPEEFAMLQNAYEYLTSLTDEEFQNFLNISGGSKESKLLQYSRDVANNRLRNFLNKEPLPFFSLIEEFENASRLKIVESANKKYIFEQFLNYMFETYFESEDGKQFYFEAYEILNKKEYDDISNLCFVILENINAIKDSKYDIDTVRMNSTEYNTLFDSFERKLKEADYDFFTEASKIIPNKMSIKFFEDHIYFHNNTDSFEKTYNINETFVLDKAHYDFNEELYYINDSVVYLFFIISSYLVMKHDVKLSLEDSINKFSRKMKRTKNKKTKSIKALLNERKEFNEELDGEEPRTNS